IRSGSWFSFPGRNGILRAIRMRFNDCYRPRTLAHSFMTNAEPADRMANIRRISIHSRMTPSLPMREAKRIAGTRCARIGYQGGSQGGWVAPLAATHAPVDFVIVSFGLAVSVIDEDQEEVALEMGFKGHSQEEISKALEVAAAAEAVFESGFTKGFERFDAVRAKYRNEPWYKDLHGNYTHFIL